MTTNGSPKHGWHKRLPMPLRDCFIYREPNPDGCGPPTPEDDAWFTHHVASLGYPRVKRDLEPMEGQMSIVDEVASMTTMPPSKTTVTEQRCPKFIVINDEICFCVFQRGHVGVHKAIGGSGDEAITR